MKRIISLMFSAIFLLMTLPSVNAESYSDNSQKLSISAAQAVLYCPDNGEVYYSKLENKTGKIASTTKIMTALLTLEYASKNNKKVKFTQDMVAEGSSMYLKIGEVVTLRDLAVGILLCSGNDAANAAAISIAGSLDKFAEMMNKRGKQIGMKNTCFVTPSGLDHENHYSTPYDMALLMSVALENQDFCKITSMKSEKVDFIKPKDKSVTYSNHNRLLSLYPYCIGGKTGYTMAAGRCLVTASRKDGLTLICVTLNDRNDWNDHIAMYNYGFDNYSMVVLDDSEAYFEVDTVGGKLDSTTLKGKGRTLIVLKSGEVDKINKKVCLDNFLYAPICDGDEKGSIVYTLKGKVIATHTIVAVVYNNSEKENKSLWDYIKGIFNNAV
ncbi:MAG: D-alanyl-D-alanine carboxypeptidase family protein [Ruminococcus sp.]